MTRFRQHTAAAMAAFAIVLVSLVPVVTAPPTAGLALAAPALA